MVEYNDATNGDCYVEKIIRPDGIEIDKGKLLNVLRDKNLEELDEFKG